MKYRTAEEILSFTFNHLETVLKGKSNDSDAFVRKTAVQADTLYTRPKRGKLSCRSPEIEEEERAE